jgi:hypothetical protein
MRIGESDMVGPVYVYYIIIGKDELLSHPDLDPDIAEYFSEPFIYTSEEGGFSRFLPTDFLLLFKLLFLIELHYDNEEVSFVQNAPISEAFFDQWWRIYRTETSSDRNHVFKRLGPEIQTKIVLTGNSRVDAVLQHLGNT